MNTSIQPATEKQQLMDIVKRVIASEPDQFKVVSVEMNRDLLLQFCKTVSNSIDVKDGEDNIPLLRYVAFVATSLLDRLLTERKDNLLPAPRESSRIAVDSLSRSSSTKPEEPKPAKPKKSAKKPAHVPNKVTLKKIPLEGDDGNRQDRHHIRPIQIAVTVRGWERILPPNKFLLEVGKHPGYLTPITVIERELKAMIENGIEKVAPDFIKVGSLDDWLEKFFPKEPEPDPELGEIIKNNVFSYYFLN